jgi:hypothetical protein
MKSTLLYIAFPLLAVSLLLGLAAKPIFHPSRYPTHSVEEAPSPRAEPEKKPTAEKPKAEPSQPNPTKKEEPSTETVDRRIEKLTIKNREPLAIFNSTRFRDDGTKITYAGMEIKGADRKSFVTLKSDYARDNNAVYFRNAVVKGADPKTFEVVGFNYGKDAQNIYYENYEINMESEDKSKKPDYDSFQVLGEDYARDKDNLYCWGEIQRKVAPPMRIDGGITGGSFFDSAGKDKSMFGNLPWATPCDFTNHHLKSNTFVEYDEVKMNEVDVNTFVRLGNLYGADKNKIYCGFTVLQGADYASFVSPIVNDNRFEPQRHAMDKNNVYYFCRKLKDVDVNSFEIIPSNNLREPEYSKDKNNMYFRESKVEGADLKTFEILSGGYAKDKNNIFYRENILMGADHDTFTNKDSEFQDKYSKFRQGARVDRENPDVEDLGQGYKKYKNEIYFNGRKIVGADLASFHYVENDNWMASDKNNVYMGGIVVENIDRESLRHLQYGYLTDKSHVYYVTWLESKIIEGADPVTFRIVNYHKTEDKNHKYYDGVMVE